MPPPAAESQEHETPELYELVARRETLPTVNLSRSVKGLLLNDARLRKLSRLEYRHRFATGLTFNISLLLTLPAVCDVFGIGGSLAIAIAIVQLPGLLTAVGNVRVDTARLLLGTYDWWYFSAANLVFTVCLATYLHDLRAVVIPGSWILHQMSIAVDAQVTTLRVIVLSGVVAAAGQAALAVSVVFEWIEAPGFVLATYSAQRYSISLRDVLLNSSMHMMVLLARMAYSKWMQLKERRKTSIGDTDAPQVTVRFITYRCEVKLHSVPPPAPSSMGRRRSWPRGGPSLSTRSLRSSGLELPSPSPTATRTQLHYRKVDMQFAADDLVVPVLWLSLARWGATQERDGSTTPWLLCLVGFYTLGFVGLAFTFASFALNLPLILGGSQLLWSVVSTASSLGFCAGYFVLCQRQLLRRLWRSFDFVYLALQLVLTLLGLCDLQLWEPSRCLAVASLGIWVHWVLTLDALTPWSRRVLRFSPAFALPVLAAGLAAQLVLVQNLFLLKREVPNLALFRGRVLGRDVEFLLMPFLLTRLLVVFMWNCRLLWRYVKLARQCCRWSRNNSIGGDGSRHEQASQLVLLKGQVEYDYVRKASRLPRVFQKARNGSLRRATLKHYLVRRLSTTDSVALARVTPLDVVRPVPFN
ncbi:hypothetical protein BBJ28_00000383 [Nothophytophthora sp. Chile5]|nr:hypothetical protein BBJ28_00000383 [Nothophytophthora sp. Chile5]